MSSLLLMESQAKFWILWNIFGASEQNGVVASAPSRLLLTGAQRQHINVAQHGQQRNPSIMI